MNRLLVATSTILLVGACRTDSPLAPTPQEKRVAPSASSALPPLQPGDSISVDRLSRAVAAALRDPTVRLQLLTDFRNSRYAKHALPLSFYSQSAGGAALFAAMSRASGIDRATLEAAAATRGGLVLAMQRVRDRLNWRGSDTLAVEGSALAIAERLEARQPSNAYMVGGGIRPVPLFETVSFAVITIAPRERWLTILPASSFSSHAATISTPREEALRTLQPRFKWSFFG